VRNARQRHSQQQASPNRGCCDDGLKEDLSPWVEKLDEAFCPKADAWGNR
jgi:hypothetical protein